MYRRHSKQLWSVVHLIHPILDDHLVLTVSKLSWVISPRTYEGMIFDTIYVFLGGHANVSIAIPFKVAVRMKFKWSCALQFEFVLVGKKVDKVLWFFHDYSQVVHVHSYVFIYVKLGIQFHPDTWIASQRYIAFGHYTIDKSLIPHLSW